MWMVYISLEEKHKAESLGTPVRDLELKLQKKGDKGQNERYDFFFVVVVFEETQRQRKEQPITAHAQLKEKQEREPGP